MELTLESWDGMSTSEREATAKGLDRPTGFVFEAMRSFALGGQSRTIAQYRFGDALFSLVPGGEVKVGFDVDTWLPTAQETESWDWTRREWNIKDAIKERVAAATLRPRRLKVRPMLVEMHPAERQWSEALTDDPIDIEIRASVEKSLATFRSMPASVRRHRKPDAPFTMHLSKGAFDIQAEIESESTPVPLTIRKTARFSPRECLGAYEAAGFSMLTSAEWEYVCGGGAPTLFRWGDHAPMDRYPTDVSPAEAEWRRQWVLSGGELERPEIPFESDWSLHRAANAFGVIMTDTPYKSELLSDLGISRGGDGGTSICGGAGFFYAWLVMAMAYFEKETCRCEADEAIDTDFYIWRRIVRL
jgi:hypothetical protein